MAGNSSWNAIRERLPAGPGLLRDPRLLVRLILGVLLAANLAAALLLFRPWAESPEEMEARLGRLRSEIQRKQQNVARLETLVEKSRKAREQGDAFMAKYFLDRRTASSTIISELRDTAAKAGIEQQEQTFSFEPIEGSDNLYMMTISGNYEGRYEDLVKFLNLLDRSPRFLILDTLAASPQRAAGALNVNFKMHAFVIKGKPRAPKAAASPGKGSAEGGRPAETASAPQEAKAG